MNADTNQKQCGAYAVKMQNFGRFHLSSTVVGHCDSLDDVPTFFDELKDKGPRWKNCEIIDIENDKENDAMDLAVKVGSDLQIFTVERVHKTADIHPQKYL